MSEPIKRRTRPVSESSDSTKPPGKRIKVDEEEKKETPRSALQDWKSPRNKSVAAKID